MLHRRDTRDATPFRRPDDARRYTLLEPYYLPCRGFVDTTSPTPSPFLLPRSRWRPASRLPRRPPQPTRSPSPLPLTDSPILAVDFPREHRRITTLFGAVSRWGGGGGCKKTAARSETIHGKKKKKRAHAETSDWFSSPTAGAKLNKNRAPERTSRVCSARILPPPRLPSPVPHRCRRRRCPTPRLPASIPPRGGPTKIF